MTDAELFLECYRRFWSLEGASAIALLQRYAALISDYSPSYSSWQFPDQSILEVRYGERGES